MQVLFVFLKWVASFAHVDERGNKMDLENLATVLAPLRVGDIKFDPELGGIRPPLDFSLK